MHYFRPMIFRTQVATQIKPLFAPLQVAHARDWWVSRPGQRSPSSRQVFGCFWLIFFHHSEELCSTKPWHFQPKHQAVTTVTTSPTPAPTCDLRRHAFHAPWYRWGGPHGELQRQRYPKCSGQTLDAGCGTKVWCNCGKCQKKRLGYPKKMAIYLYKSGFLSLMILAICLRGQSPWWILGGYWWVPHFQSHVRISHCDCSFPTGGWFFLGHPHRTSE